MKKNERKIVETYDYAQQIIGVALSICPPILRRLFYKVSFANFGKNIYIGPKCFFRYPWKIRVGSNTSIGGGCQIYPSFKGKESFVIIGSNVLIGPNLCIFGAGHPVGSLTDSHVSSNVVIGDNVFIGGNVTIRYGVSVGEGATIGVGSIVTKDVPAFSVVAGNPAIIIK
jgi:maltose O-acetyltransferase